MKYSKDHADYLPANFPMHLHEPYQMKSYHASSRFIIKYKKIILLKVDGDWHIVGLLLVRLRAEGHSWIVVEVMAMSQQCVDIFI